MDLTLTGEEAAILRRLLQNALGELPEEVYKTENYEWRKGLQQDERIMRSLQERLGQPEGMHASGRASA